MVAQIYKRFTEQHIGSGSLCEESTVIVKTWCLALYYYILYADVL